MERTLPEGWRARAGWPAHHQRAERSLDDGQAAGRGQTGRALEPGGPAGDSDQQPLIDRNAVQYLDRVRAIFRPTRSDTLAPGLERFIGVEDIFRHVGTADMASHEAQPMMQCPSHWPNGATWVPIRDLEVLEILDDQDVRAG